MSSGGPAASSSGWFIRPRERGTGSADSVGRTQNFSLTGPYAMAPAEHREPCESRGSCTVLGAPGGEIPPGDSTKLPGTAPASARSVVRHKRTHHLLGAGGRANPSLM